jgi:hypothetical protein
MNQSQQNPQFDNWKDAWEWNASQAQKQLLELSEDELLNLIANDQDDAFYQIWTAIGAKGTREKSLPILIGFLERRDDECFDLARYHCIEALFKILKIKDQKIIDDFQTKISQLSQKKNKERLKEGIGELKAFFKK